MPPFEPIFTSGAPRVYWRHQFSRATDALFPPPARRAFLAPRRECRAHTGKTRPKGPYWKRGPTHNPTPRPQRVVKRYRSRPTPTSSSLWPRPRPSTPPRSIDQRHRGDPGVMGGPGAQGLGVLSRRAAGEELRQLLAHLCRGRRNQDRQRRRAGEVGRARACLRQGHGAAAPGQRRCHRLQTLHHRRQGARGAGLRQPRLGQGQVRSGRAPPSAAI